MWVEIKKKNYNFNNIDHWHFVEDGRYGSDEKYGLNLLYSNGKTVLVHLDEYDYTHLISFLNKELKVRSFTNFVKS